MTIVIHSFVGSHVISSTTELTTIDSTTAVNQSSDESNLPIDYVLTPEDHEDAKDGDLNKRDKKSPYYRNQPNMVSLILIYNTNLLCFLLNKKNFYLNADVYVS